MGRSNSRGRSNLRNPKIAIRTPREPVSIYIPTSVIKIVLGFLVLSGIYFFVYLSGFFSIKNIILTDTISEEERQTVYAYKGKNILFLNSEDLEREIKAKYPQAWAVSVYRGLPDTLKVVMSERNKAFIWQSGEKFYYIDKQGIAFKEINEPEEGWLLVNDLQSVKVKLGKRIVSGRFIEFVEETRDSLLKKSEIKIGNFEVGETTLHVSMVTDLGWKVYFDINRSPENQLEDLYLILAKHREDIKEYVDLRVPGYGYYK
jgi:cell division septal protein FtsQ